MADKYGVGTANRYALFMGQEGMDPLDVVKNLKGKENKSATSSAKKGPAAGTASNNKNASKTTATAASAAPAPKALNNNVANSKGSAPTQARQQPQNAGTKEGKTSGQAKPHQRNQPAAAANDHSGPASGSGTSKRETRPNGAVTSRDDRPRADRPSDGKPRPNREARGPRGPRGEAPPVVDWSGTGSQSQKDVEERKNRRNREDRPLQSSNFVNPDNSGEDKGPRTGPRERVFRGRAGPTRGPGSRPQRPFDTRDGRGKPVFDRHSGSDKAGVKAIEKRDGAGAHNWGTMNDEIAAQNDAETETQAKADDGSAPAENSENQPTDETEAAKEAEESGPKELTLEEWKRLNGVSKRAQPKYNLRQANEGVDENQFKKTYLLQKKKEEEESEYEEIEVITEAKESKKKVIDIEINFNNTFRGSDDRRGGRGGFRGGRGGGREGGFRRDGEKPFAGDDRRKRPPNGPAGSSRKQAAPKVDDVNDFPSLGVAA